MDAPARVLVVDDDRDIRTLLAEYLSANGFLTNAVEDGIAMWAALAQAAFDLIVLDVTLPGTDGLTLCRTLRAQSALPVIMLTARGEAVDRILGLEMGADDYVAKPFEPRELLARIRSVLRRTSAATGNGQPQKLRFGTWVLDVRARHLINPAGVVVALSGAEFRLLRTFLDHPHGVLSREQLLDLTLGREIDAFDRSIDSQVSRLRQKIGDDGRTPVIIKTVRSEGYVLAVSVTAET